ncbi:MAG: PAS domain S-box protein, partial [Chloroflexota bacterium]
MDTRVHAALLRAVGHILIAATFDGEVVYWNGIAEQTLGWSAADVVGRESLHLFVPEDLAERSEQIRTRVLNGEVWCGEFCLRRRDGTRVPVLAIASALRDRLEHVVGVIAVYTDVTERKRYENALQESEERFRRVVETSQEGIWMTDLDGVITFVNPSFASLLGHQVADMLGQPLDAFLDDEGRAQIATNLEHRQRNRPQRADVKFVRQDGTLVWAQVACGALFDKHGLETGVLAMIADVTDRRRAEAESARLAAIVISSEDAIFAKNLDGIITNWNAGAERLYGYSAEDIVGQSASLLAPPERVDEIPMLLERLGRGEVVNRFQTVRRRKDGSRLDVSLSLSPIIDRAGRVTGGAIIAHDITASLQVARERDELNAKLEERVIERTQALASAVRGLEAEAAERKLMELQLRVARDEALAASRAKSAFLATMSHEIRTPMNGVIGMTGLLMDTPLTPRQFEYADAVRRSGEALLIIINDILDFSKIEAGKLELELARVNVQETVEDVLELLAQQAHSNGLELAALNDPGVPPGMLGDPSRIRQVLLNLVANAVKFTQHGEVVVRTHLEDHVPGETATVRFDVTDTGIGFSQETAARLFQSFSQADSSTTRKYGGTGLGLAICKALVQQMGGTIGADSEAGRGSTFWFTVRLMGPATATPKSTAVAELVGLRVLAVDDNATNRAIIREQLSASGLVVTTATDGPSALECLREAIAYGRPFAVAVLDMCMPGMDGAALAAAIRADQSIAGTPLGLLTSVGEEGSAELFAAVLTKPARPAQLLKTLTSALGLHVSTASAAGSTPPSAPVDDDCD